MESMFSKMSRKVGEKFRSAREFYNRADNRDKIVYNTALALALVALPEMAMAQQVTGGGIFCFIAQYFKGVVAAAAVVVIVLWAIEHIFGVSKLHSVVITVGTASAFVLTAVKIVESSGLGPTNCVL